MSWGKELGPPTINGVVAPTPIGVAYGEAAWGTDQVGFRADGSGGLPHDLGDVFGSGGTTPPLTDNTPSGLDGGLGRFIEGLGQVVQQVTGAAAPPSSTPSLGRYVMIGAGVGALVVWALLRR